MTDAHFMALLVIATWLYARAHRAGRDRWSAASWPGRAWRRWPFSPGSKGLDRPGGVDLPAALAAVALRPGQPPGLVAALRPAAAGGGRLLPLAALWQRRAGRCRSTFFREILDEGWSGTWWLLRRLTVVELMYLGLFTLPLIAAALPAVRGSIATIAPRGWILFAAWQAILLVGVTALWVRGALHALHRAVFRLGRARALRMSSARVRSCSAPRSARR